MTISHKHQRATLFNALITRHQKRAGAMTMGALQFLCEFENAGQLIHALDALVETGHITWSIEEGARHPSIRIWKSHYRALMRFQRPHCLLPPGQVEDQSEPDVFFKVETSAGVDELTPFNEGVSADDDVLRIARQMVAEAADQFGLQPEPVAEPLPIPTPEPTPAIAKVAEPPRKPTLGRSEPYVSKRKREKERAAAVAVEAKPPRDPRTIQFVADDELFDWLNTALDEAQHPFSLPSLCKSFLHSVRVNMTTPGKPRISADLIRSAAENNEPLDHHIVRLAGIGLTALDMNRKGF